MEHERPAAPQGPTSSGRRTFLAGAAAAGVTAWVAPSIIAVDAAAAQSVEAVVVVATGASGTIISSPDAISWTEQISGATNNLKGVAWSPTLSLYAAVGSGGTIVTSPDGIAWTTRVSPTPRELNSITWESAGAQFVAVGNAKTVVTSSDGVTWVLRTTGVVGDPDHLSVAHDGVGVLVAVGTGGTIDRSTDGGASWLAQVTGVTDDLLAAEWFGDASVFVVVGVGGVALSSPAGVTWSPETTGTTDDLVGLEWSDALDEVVAVEGDVTGEILSSSDASTWTGTAVGASIKAVTYSPGLALYIAVGSSGSVWTSPASTGPWTSRTTPISQNLLAVVASM